MIERIAVAIALTFAPAVFAQTYIVPDGNCGAVTFHTTRGACFPSLGETIAADQVTDAHVYPGHQIVAVTPLAAPHSLDFNAQIPDNGVVMAAVDFKPVVSGNETRTEHAKAFVFCGAKAPIADWQSSTRLGFEIIPQSWNGLMPLKPGATMRFIAVEKGLNKLIPDIPMELYRAGAGLVGQGVLAQYGGMNFPYAEPGRYMVKATYRRPDPQQPEHWLVDTSTLTFEMK